MYLQPLGADGRVLVFGADHVGEKLAPVAKSVGFEVIVMDDREVAVVALSRRRWLRVLGSFQDDLFQGLGDLSDTYCVILTRGHLHDKEVLAACLKTGARYIGMIGSRKKTKAVFTALQEEGSAMRKSPAAMRRSAVLKIGAETPEEIAVSIAGELIAVRALGHASMGAERAAALILAAGAFLSDGGSEAFAAIGAVCAGSGHRRLSRRRH